MPDLVDYLREKIAAANVSVRFVEPSAIAYGAVRVLLWPDRWDCEVCPATGPRVPGPRDAWDHLNTHVPAKRKRWWRR